MGDWTDAELQAIVADYFSMLESELAGRPYSKTEHRNELLKTVHRSPGSIERKHQNISAVLQELGLSWINGYKPLVNFQDALVDAVETPLVTNISSFDQIPATLKSESIRVPVLVPIPDATSHVRGHSMVRVLKRLDPAARDAENRLYHDLCGPDDE